MSETVETVMQKLLDQAGRALDANDTLNAELAIRSYATLRHQPWPSALNSGLAIKNHIEDSVMKLAVNLRVSGRRLDVARVNDRDFAAMVERLGAKVSPPTTPADSSWINIHTAGGPVRVVSDASVSPGIAITKEAA